MKVLTYSRTMSAIPLMTASPFCLALNSSKNLWNSVENHVHSTLAINMHMDTRKKVHVHCTHRHAEQYTMYMFMHVQYYDTSKRDNTTLFQGSHISKKNELLWVEFELMTLIHMHTCIQQQLNKVCPNWSTDLALVSLTSCTLEKIT